jgi:hypothetical protein
MRGLWLPSSLVLLNYEEELNNSGMKSDGETNDSVVSSGENVLFSHMQVPGGATRSYATW